MEIDKRHKIIKKTLKILSGLFIITAIFYVAVIRDEYSYPPMFFCDTNPVMILLFKNSKNINKGDAHGTTPIMKAVSVGDKTAVKLLLMKGADVDGKDNDSSDDGDFMTDNGFCDYIDSTVIFVDESTLGYNGIIIRDMEIKYRIFKWIYRNTWIRPPVPIGDGMTPAEGMVCVNDYRMVEFLIKNGAKVPALSEVMYYRKGKTEKILQILLKYGADKNEGQLGSALTYGDLRIAKLFLENGVSANIRGKKIKYENMPLNRKSFSKKIPLKESVRRNDTERVKLLLEYGADINLKDDETGESTVEYVEKNGNSVKKEIAEMIKRVEKNRKN